MGKFVFVFVVLLATASSVFMLFPANNASNSSRIFSTSDAPGQEASMAAEFQELGPQTLSPDEELVANSETVR